MLISEEAVKETGFTRRILAKEMALTRLIGEFASICQQSGIEWALFGGTAINKFYLGTYARFSEDADFHLFSTSPAKALSTCKRLTGCTVKGMKRIFKEFFRVELHYSDEENGVEDDVVHFDANLSLRRPASKIVYKKTSSLLDRYGFIVHSLQLPTYSPETLIAMKLLAVSGRTAGKDTYDLYHLLNKYEVTRSAVMAEASKYRHSLFDFQRFDEHFIENAYRSVSSADEGNLEQINPFLRSEYRPDWRVLKKELRRLMTLKLGLKKNQPPQQ